MQYLSYCCTINIHLKNKNTLVLHFFNKFKVIFKMHILKLFRTLKSQPLLIAINSVLTNHRKLKKREKYLFSSIT